MKEIYLEVSPTVEIRGYEYSGDFSSPQQLKGEDLKAKVIKHFWDKSGRTMVVKDDHVTLTLEEATEINFDAFNYNRMFSK